MRYSAANKRVLKNITMMESNIEDTKRANQAKKDSINKKNKHLGGGEVIGLTSEQITNMTKHANDLTKNEHFVKTVQQVHGSLIKLPIAKSFAQYNIEKGLRIPGCVQDIK